MTIDHAWMCAEDVEASVLKLWLKGRILSAKVTGEAIFPLRMHVRGPDSSALAARFGDAQTWVRALEAASRTARGFGFDLVWREVRHRQLGRNRLPSEIVVPTEADALQLIRKQADAKRFDALARATATAFPELLPWLARKPLLALEHAADWTRILAVLAWFRQNPRSGLYLRQVDIPQIDTKFIEGRRGLLTELLDVVMSPPSSETAPGNAFTFEGRYGLRNKPATVRFRLLDGQTLFAGLSDVSTPAEEFARLDLNPRVVFITENEVNGLAFPPVDEAVVLFGLGYSLDLLAKAEWLRRSCLVYWGDIDTHGFAMLARLRAYFPTAQSLLMDEATLLTHRSLWVREERPFVGELPRLSEAERRLFEDLKLNRYGDHVRLEQERITYGCLMTALRGLAL
ncbi:MAG: DUF3322 domain-containing protein [Phenylobacterium sp.]|uniref:DUF3322 domain-containing protein n=1 Tax=Phenylobacterium sp. TaxID=1871053 RepID=UPI0027360DB5|nr:DUF3322 domain-containing protein [Phenylobacterium sp.]MDP3749574.1 DUF3322 domain-containing protein [Phenylobacterium sp.]